MRPKAPCLLLLASLLPAQAQLPVPPEVQRARLLGTRSTEGLPGPRYWQNGADYRLEVEVDPLTRRLEGKGEILYRNASPHTLDQLRLHLLQNLYRKGTPREVAVDPGDEHGGMALANLRVEGQPLDVATWLSPTPTGAWLRLPRPLAPGGTLKLSFTWACTLNARSHQREGAVDPTTLFAAYWFPRVAVFDDLRGWDPAEHTGLGEFYNDFGSFDVRITVPGTYRVWSTGELANPGEVLSPATRARLEQAGRSDAPVVVASSQDAEAAFRTPEPRTWRFKAQQVSDVAFGLSDHYRWEACSLVVDPATGRRVRVETAYPEGSADFREVLAVARRAVDHMSRVYPAVPFPYPKITVFQGLADMEYPMMVNDGPRPDPVATVKLTSHEIYHTYHPFLMGCDETRHAWMDEGLTGMADFLYLESLNLPRKPPFFFWGALSADPAATLRPPLPLLGPAVGPSHHFPLSYIKGGAFWLTLRDALGPEHFRQRLADFMKAWAGRHATPSDLLAFLQKGADEDLGWLVRPWTATPGVPDLGLALEQDGRALKITRAELPLPVRVKVRHADGREARIQRSVKAWKGTTTLRIPLDSPAVSAELDDPALVDVDPSNNLWPVRR